MEVLLDSRLNGTRFLDKLDRYAVDLLQNSMNSAASVNDAVWGSIFQAPQAPLKGCWPGNLNRTTSQQGMMK